MAALKRNWLAAVGLSLTLLAAPVQAQVANGETVVNGAVQSVSVAPAQAVFVYPRREALAAVRARNRSRVAAQVSALIANLMVEAGDTVAAGAVLAQLDDTDIRLSLTQAVAAQDGLIARLQLARRQLKRLRNLKSNNFVSTEAVNQRDAEVVSLRAELKASRAQVAIIRRQLDKCIIRAPFDAVVTERQAQLGELAVPGAVLFTLVQRGREFVAADVSALDAAHLATAKAPVLHAPQGPVALRLTKVSPVLSPVSRTRRAHFDFVAGQVAVGTEGRVRWPDPRPHLPPSVVVRRAGKLGVFTVRDAVASFVVLPDAQEGRPVAATLQPAQLVVVDGQAALRHGDRVRARPAQAN